jgi:hypothetical protein
VCANVQFLPAFVAMVGGVTHARDDPEDAIRTIMKHGRREREVSGDASHLVKERLNLCPQKRASSAMK